MLTLFHYQLPEKPLEGFHIVVDAGNGAGGFFTVSSVTLYLNFLDRGCATVMGTFLISKL